MTAVPHVIHLVISLAPGGLERLVVDWTNARNRRHPGSTLICCLDEKGVLAGQVEGDAMISLAATRSRRPFDIAAVRQLRKLLSCSVAELLRENSKGILFSSSTTQQLNNLTTVLHSHNVAAWQYGVLACMGKGIRHIHTEHGTNPHSSGWANRLRNALLWRMTDAVAVVAENVADQISRLQRIPRSRLHVIPNGIKSALWNNNARPPTGIIGSVGRLAKVKGYDRLLKAFARMVIGDRLSVTESKTNNPYSLLLVGDGPERVALEEQARGLGITDRVTFAGYQEDPRPYYGMMDLFVLPSRSEGLSISLLEAMAAGVPVAVTDVGENREVVEEERAGIILPDEEGQWAKIITQALQDPQTAQRAIVAKERVRTQYSQDATLDGYEGLYRTC